MVVTVFGENRAFFRILETLPKASRVVLALRLGPGKVNEPGAPEGAWPPGNPLGFCCDFISGIGM